MIEIRPFEPRDEAAVIALWERCGLTRAWNDPNNDGHRGSVNYLAVDPQHRRRGYGAALMRCVEETLAARGCPKVNLLVRASNAEVLAFYRKLGYAPDEVAALGKRLIPD